MVIGNVLEHALDGVPGRVAFAVVAPSSGAVSGRIGNAVRQSTAERLVAIGRTSLVIVRIEMGVGQVKDLERLAAIVDDLLADERRFGNGRQGDLPVVIRIVRDGADVADNETANFVSCQNQTGQDKDDFVRHGVDDSLADSMRFYFEAHAQFGGGVDDLVR